MVSNHRLNALNYPKFKWLEWHQICRRRSAANNCTGGPNRISTECISCTLIMYACVVLPNMNKCFLPCFDWPQTLSGRFSNERNVVSCMEMIQMYSSRWQVVRNLTWNWKNCNKPTSHGAPTNHLLGSAFPIPSNPKNKMRIKVSQQMEHLNKL